MMKYSMDQREDYAKDLEMLNMVQDNKALVEQYQNDYRIDLD